MNAPSAALHVRESGQPGSPAIVFLHGTGASGGCGRSTCSGWGLPLPGARSPWTGRSNHLPWSSRIDTAEQVAGLIRSRIASRRAHVVGLSLVHTLLARHRELLDRVVIDGCGALPAWWIGPMKLAVAAVSPGIHRDPVIGLFARMVGMAPSGRDRFAAELQAVSPRAFRRAFADGNGARISAEEVSAPLPDPAGDG